MAGIPSIKASYTRLALIALLVAFMFVPRPEYLSEKCLLSAITHHFWHANWFHLSANCLAIWLALDRRRTMSEIALALSLASLSYIAATAPCIGFSNAIFSVAGMRSAHYDRKMWLNPNTIAFVATMFVMLLIPQFSSLTHIAAFALGFVYERVSVRIKETSYVLRETERRG